MRFVTRLLLACAASVVMMHPAPAAAAELSFSPADTLITTFNIFPVRVEVDAIEEIMGYNISVTITGDPCLQIAGIVEGDLPGSGGDPTFFRWLTPGDSDSIAVNGSVLGTTVDGPGVLFTIYFKALAPGTAWLDFSYSDLRNGINESIVHAQAEPARIIVDRAIAVEEISWGGLKSLPR
jgi:hypothetical protein